MCYDIFVIKQGWVSDRLESSRRMAKSGMEESDVESDGEGAAGAKSMEKEQKTETAASLKVISARLEVTTQISILIESLVQNICGIYESDTEKATKLYNLICDELFQMKMIDESYLMTEFEGIRMMYQQGLQQLLKHSYRAENAICSRPEWPKTDVMNSHYYQEFDEIEYIAGGGFGQVYKVKHKLDGTEYAVKKIPIQAEGIEAVRNYLSEVKTFASVNHSNIVQYKAAWLELGAPTSNHILDHDESESFSGESKSHTHLDDEYIYHDQPHSFSNECIGEDTSEFEVNFEHSVSSVTNHSVNRKRIKKSSISEGGNTICKLDLKEIKQLKLQHRANVKWATLYIQMALCQSTLKQWLERRNNAELQVEDGSKALVPVAHVRSETIYEVARQLLKGLKYIHSKGIVHHDIKPSNIFIQLENGNLLVQLGDFGLACPLQNVRHSLAFGTKMYAAPEQLNGLCDSKSDMYSLGIVLFELIERFRTDMERVQYIDDLRKGTLPTHVHIQHPQLAQIIMQLMSKYPEERPDATALLKMVARSTDADYVRELECKLAERDEEILRLKELLKSAGVKTI